MTASSSSPARRPRRPARAATPKGVFAADALDDKFELRTLGKTTARHHQRLCRLEHDFERVRRSAVRAWVAVTVELAVIALVVLGAVLYALALK